MVRVSARRRTDEDIMLDVVAGLRWDARVDASDVRVEVRKGRVRLTGTVPSYTARAAAVEQAWSTQGVLDVEDALQVVVKQNVPGGQDDDLMAKANDIIGWHLCMDDCDVQAVVQDGVLELQGTVDEHWKVRYAERLLAGIRGIREVRNNLAVALDRSVADEDLAEEITAALSRNSLVDEDHVKVRVKDGIVTLHGCVACWHEADAAREVASAAHGTLEVRDQLELFPTEEKA